VEIVFDLWNPSQDFERLRGDVDRLFGRYARAASGDGDQVLRPATRIHEGPDAFRVRLDLPGVPQQEIDVEVQAQWLRVRATRREDGLQLRYEQSLTMPEQARLDAVEARCADGVLELVIPKREEVRPRRVQITPGAGQEVLESGQTAKKGDLVEAGG
jgi:HSP20 family protein